METMLEKAKRIAEQEAEKLGLEIVSVSFVKEYGMKILRVVADKEFGLTLEDSERLNLAMRKVLDEDDITDEDYYLEVSSVGAERQLKTRREIEHAIGRYVSIKTDKGKFFGDLMEVTDDSLTLRINNKGRMSKTVFKNVDIQEIRLAVKI
ncbi:MAG TPA: ribosome maturation factor RimP [Bacilli bacterium]|nr:ribosome maturation factor RimP [Bacilli bacterium]HQD91679.1 ribosome maturation factor RimP [Bacilli bacterium]